MISDNDGKDDPVDAELLARLGRVDVKLLSPIEHRGEQAQADLAVIRARDALVAVARKLAVLLHRLWVHGEVCQPLYQAERAVAVTAAAAAGSVS